LLSKEECDGMAYLLAEALQLSDNRQQLYRRRASARIDTWRSVMITFNLISLAYRVDARDTRAESGWWHMEAGDLNGVFEILRQHQFALEGAVWLPLSE
jgi:uncharacterized membrane protein